MNTQNATDRLRTASLNLQQAQREYHELLDAQAAAEASSLQHLAGKYYRHQGQYQRIVAVRVQNHAAEAICQRVLTNETTSLYDTHSTLARFIEPATWAEVSQQEFQQALDARIQQLLAGMEAA